MMIKLKDLRIAEETIQHYICFCCFHKDEHKPNLVVTKRGKYRGQYHCFACGKHGLVDMGGKTNVVKRLKNKPVFINWAALNNMYVSNYRVIKDKKFDKWDVSDYVLWRMNIGWNGESHTFPVRGIKKEIIGIQRIFSDNSKKMVSGSHLGIIIPIYSTFKHNIIVTEGISDTAVGLNLGLNCVGKLSAACGIEILIKLITNTNNTKVIIIPDNDKIGIKFAKKLATGLQKRNKCGIIIPSEGNDLRDWVKKCGKEEVKKKLLMKLNRV